MIDHRKEFIKTFNGIARHHDRYAVFSDFLEMATCAIRKRTVPEGEGADALEARYMAVVKRHDKDDVRKKFPDLLGLIHLALHNDPSDFLGEIYGELELNNRHAGQFFTPYSLSLMMAKMTFDTVDEIIAERGFVTMQEPASGAGGMVLAAAQAIQEKGFDPTRHLYVEAIDVSDMAFKMTYVQAAIRGIPATVRRGNTLSLEMFETAHTPEFPVFYSRNREAFDAWRAGETPDAEISQSDPEAEIGPPPPRPLEPKGSAKPKQLSLFDV